MRGTRHPVRRLALFLAMSFAGTARLCAETGGTDLISAETLTVTADFRLIGADGERAWMDGGFGKTRYGGSTPSARSPLAIEPKFAEANLIWQPRFSWSLSGTVVALAQQNRDKGTPQAGLSEAYLSWKPLSGGPVRVSARAGFMWPPVSLEHSGAEWAVTESITPSAINSWMGEEVKVVGLEAGAGFDIGTHKIAVTGALFDVNDTAGAMVAFRGWALHDAKVMAGRFQPLPPLNGFVSNIQPRYTHPVMEIDGGFMKRPGYYAKIAWDLPIQVHLEALHYDNGGDPKAVNAELEWGWRTKFDNVGLVANIAHETQLRVQGMSGSTLMGFPMGGKLWIDTRFRSAYGLVTHYFPRGSVSGRVEAFATHNRGSALTSADDEDGWSAMLAARRTLSPNLTVLAEALHVESSKDARLRTGLSPEQSTNQLQMSLRLRW